eukprot:SAG31_NODE_16146_length_721_cov_1.073955_1_plen_151_part_00
MGTDGAVQQPPPMGYDIPEDDVEVHVKGAHLAGQQFLAVKMATGGYLNRQRGIGPSGAGLVLVVDAKTGYPAAVLLDNAWLTDMRTAAAGALAACVPLPERFLVSGSRASKDNLDKNVFTCASICDLLLSLCAGRCYALHAHRENSRHWR